MAIQIVAIQGTVWPGNFTARALALVADELRKHDDVGVELIDPSTLNLPFPGLDGGGQGAKLLQEKVSAATGVILSTPEQPRFFRSACKPTFRARVRTAARGSRSDVQIALLNVRYASDTGSYHSSFEPSSQYDARDQPESGRSTMIRPRPRRMR